MIFLYEYCTLTNPSTLPLGSSVSNRSKMVFGTLIYVSVLSLNAIAILNEERFLSRVGWSPSALAYEQQHSFSSGGGPHGGGGGGPGGGGEASVKERLVNLISAVRTLLRMPLCILNLLIIVYEVFRF